VDLDLLGVTAVLGSILGAAGINGLAIGIAVRDSVENFVASEMLSIRQPFEAFDLVEIDGDVGKVVRLTSRATVLISVDGLDSLADLSTTEERHLGRMVEAERQVPKTSDLLTMDAPKE
jgi:hypothetical protein